MTLLLCSISPGKFLGLSGAEFSVPVTRPRQLGSPSPPLPSLTRRKEVASFRICGASSILGERKLRLRVGETSLRGIRTYSAGVSLGSPARKEGKQEVGRELCQ